MGRLEGRIKSRNCTLSIQGANVMRECKVVSNSSLLFGWQRSTGIQEERIKSRGCTLSIQGGNVMRECKVVCNSSYIVEEVV